MLEVVSVLLVLLVQVMGGTADGALQKRKSLCVCL
jgi:hypothetical protein